MPYRPLWNDCLAYRLHNFVALSIFCAGYPLSTPAVKAASAATAGILLYLGNIKNAQAATSSPGVKPVIDQTIAIRAVPINDFEPRGGVPHASSAGLPEDLHTGVCYTPEAAKRQFDLGREVFYDNRSHWIIGRFSVR